MLDSSVGFRAGRLLLVAAVVLVTPQVGANEGTVRRYFMPIAATMGVALPRPGYYMADGGNRGMGIALRGAPISFYWKHSWGELMFVPFNDLDVVLATGWSGTRVRGSQGLRTVYFPFSGGPDIVGIHVDGGGSVGFGGPAGLIGGGLTIGGKMGTVGLSYRRALGRDDSVHTFTFDLGLTYPIQLGKQTDDH